MEETETTMDFVDSKRKRSTQKALMTKLYNELEKNMMSRDNIYQVKVLFQKLYERFEQFKNAHLQCLDLCSVPDVAENLELTYEYCLQNFVEFRERFSQWTAIDKKTPEEDDACSVASRISSASSGSAISELRNAKAKRLVLEHKLKKMKEGHEFELASKELKLKKQMFDTQCELEEAVLEESVWREADCDKSGTKTDDEDRAAINVSNLAPRSATEYPGPDVHVDGGRAGVSSTGSVGVSDLFARTSVTHTSVTNPNAKASTSEDHGQRDLRSTQQSTHNNSALAVNSTSDISVSHVDDRTVTSAPSKEQPPTEVPLPKVNNLISKEDAPGASDRKPTPERQKPNPTPAPTMRPKEHKVERTLPPAVETSKPMGRGAERHGERVVVKPAQATGADNTKTLEERDRKQGQLQGVAGRSTQEEDRKRREKFTGSEFSDGTNASTNKYRPTRTHLPSDDHGPSGVHTLPAVSIDPEPRRISPEPDIRQKVAMDLKRKKALMTIEKTMDSKHKARDSRSRSRSTKRKKKKKSLSRSRSRSMSMARERKKKKRKDRLYSRSKSRSVERKDRYREEKYSAEDNVRRGHLSLGRVVKVIPGRDGHVRSCVVRTRGSQSVKPITKLCLLETAI
ncbi:serine/arginine repetitive matrix protein 2-like [Dreissena polymorpha]|uniref:DUF5641 domain-containing protein n=1 Tax=Dreissena polymorpha TaxID=45954 RepID=A0A9D4C1E7_DREPO|nr:serine/arginine repetitive matrix protein 2-like [Dreissena polymorpha]KAH3715405.1 hypothetical protein DPMN_058114 [Dreissena polymorpha]